MNGMNLHPLDVVITGTSCGIGKAIAKRFIAEGHQVYGIDILESSIHHPRYHHLVHDIRSAVAPDVPAPEILINNAGTIDEADAIDINLTGTIHFTRQMVGSPRLRSVLFIASASARNGAEFPLYVASKAGIVGYMKNLALELAHRGITCNSISPGGVITPLNRHIIESKKLYAEVLAETMLGKWSEPEEIADFAYFLTVHNRSMTGEDLLIDNGEQLKSNFVW